MCVYFSLEKGENLDSKPLKQRNFESSLKNLLLSRKTPEAAPRV